ncbi:MAG TPA: retropepsin-like aspartic protease, partial [Ktedonobacterales bacterium]|nr:retropepsin-like aspartic protease [Ktedonobacterales bacterium]
MSGFALIIQPDDEEPEAAEVLVDGSVGGRPYRFLLDTGAAQSALLSDEYTATFAAVERRASSGVFASGSDDVIIAPSVTLGPIVRRDFPLTRLSENTPHRRSLIGMDLLKDVCCHFL